MNKILRLVCRQADFKKIVSIGFFAAFLAVFLSTGTAQAGFLDWFNLNKASNDSQQAAAVTNTKATSTSSSSRSSRSSSSKSNRSSATTTPSNA